MKEKSFILTHTMYCWLLYLCDLWLVLWSIYDSKVFKKCSQSN